MEASHRPWKFHVEVNKRFDPITGEPLERKNAWVKNANGQSVALISTVDDQFELVGNMMAAAPEMLAALEECLYVVASEEGSDDSLSKKIEALIKKAKGES